MKFQVSMKDPDTLDDAIDSAIDDLELDPTLSEEEVELVKENRKEETRKMCGKWFQYGEYLVVEIDTEAGTCTVVPAK